jgi:hypothetical protein
MRGWAEMGVVEQVKEGGQVVGRVEEAGEVREVGEVRVKEVGVVDVVH